MILNTPHSSTKAINTTGKKSQNQNTKKNLTEVALNEAEAKTKSWTTLEKMLKLHVGQVLWLPNDRRWKYRNIIKTLSQDIRMENF